MMFERFKKAPTNLQSYLNFTAYGIIISGGGNIRQISIIARNRGSNGKV